MVEVTSPLGHTYSLRHEGLSVSLANGQRNLLWQAIVTVSVSRDGEPQGILTTEKRQYTTQDMGSPPMTEVGIKSYPLEDLYLILSELDDMQGAVSADSEAQGLYLQVLVKPLVSWIWLGCRSLPCGCLGTRSARWAGCSPLAKNATSRSAT